MGYSTHPARPVDAMVNPRPNARGQQRVVKRRYALIETHASHFERSVPLLDLGIDAPEVDDLAPIRDHAARLRDEEFM